MNVTDQRRQEVWKLMAELHPEFTREHCVFDDPWAVESLLLGDFLGFLPSPGARCMDVGANVGIVSAYLALQGCQVRAYEADPETFTALFGMLTRTGLLQNVDAVQAAIWTHTGVIPFEGRGYQSESAEGRNGAVQVVSNTTPGEPRGNTEDIKRSPLVPCISFAHALADERWDFVKMDIEGAEFEVLLRTPLNALARIGFLQVEFHHGWADDILYGRVLGRLEEVFRIHGPKNPDGRFHHAQFRKKLS
jgi:FkbM family methyltransferase